MLFNFCSLNISHWVNQLNVTLFNARMQSVIFWNVSFEQRERERKKKERERERGREITPLNDEDHICKNYLGQINVNKQGKKSPGRLRAGANFFLNKFLVGGPGGGRWERPWAMRAGPCGCTRMPYGTPMPNCTSAHTHLHPTIHTRTHTTTHPHTHTHTHTHTRTHTLTNTHMNTQTCTHRNAITIGHIHEQISQTSMLPRRRNIISSV